MTAHNPPMDLMLLAGRPETSIKLHYKEFPLLTKYIALAEQTFHHIANQQVVFHFNKGDQQMTRVKVFAEGIVAKGLLDRIVDLIGKEFLQELLQGLLRGMLDCDAPADGAEAKATVQRNYKGNGRYRGRFFARVSRIARQEARLLEGGLSRESSHEVAFVTLEQIRLGKDQEMSIMIQEGNRRYGPRVVAMGSRS